MSVEERQRQFKENIGSHAGIRAAARIAENVKLLNSARVVEGGLSGCTNNLQTYSRKLTDSPSRAVPRFASHCALNLPPQDEVYFAIVVGQEAGKVNSGLVKLAREFEARSKTAAGSRRAMSSINNSVIFYIISNGSPYFGAVTLRPGMSVEDIAIALIFVVTDAKGV